MTDEFGMRKITEEERLRMVFEAADHAARVLAAKNLRLKAALERLVLTLDEGGNGEGWTLEEALVQARTTLKDA